MITPPARLERPPCSASTRAAPADANTATSDDSLIPSCTPIIIKSTTYIAAFANEEINWVAPTSTPAVCNAVFRKLQTFLINFPTTKYAITESKTRKTHFSMVGSPSNRRLAIFCNSVVWAKYKSNFIRYFLIFSFLFFPSFLVFSPVFSVSVLLPVFVALVLPQVFSVPALLSIFPALILLLLLEV